MIYTLAVDAVVTQSVSVILGIIGLGALVFTALRFRREDTGALVEQATKLVTGMDTLTDELRAERDDARQQRDQMRTENAALHVEIAALRVENRSLCDEVVALRDEVKKLRIAIQDRGI